MSLPEVTRRMFADSDKKRDAGLKTPDYIERFDDISYGPYGKWNLLDIYRPKQDNAEKSANYEKLPVIISVHGGGWVYGDKEVYQFYCMSLADRGFAVVNYNYRLAPEDKFPASLYDTDNVIRWIYENAGKYGLDTDNVFAVGDSAGANLLGVYINLLNDDDYLEKLKSYIASNSADIGNGRNSKDERVNDPGFVLQKDIKIKAAALNCGKYSFDDERDKPGLKNIVRSLFENNGTDEELLLIDVLAHINDSFPPVFIMTCTGDFLIREAGKLSDVLSDKGLSFEYHFYSEGDNEKPLGHVFHCNMRLDTAKKCNAEECEFFKKYMS